MASSRVSNEGNTVVLRLTFLEMAALEALLTRVTEDTHQGIADATIMVWSELRDRHDELVAAGLLPDNFEDFRSRPVPLRGGIEDQLDPDVVDPTELGG